MDPTESNGDNVELNIKKLKEKYSQEMKDDDDNPVKCCLKLIFSAAVEKNHQKRLELATELSKFLMKSDGIINLFLAVIDFDASSQKVTTLNQRYMAIANIITGLPTIHIPYDEFCSNIFHQLRPLLISDNSQYSSLASIIVKSMFDSPRAKQHDVKRVTIDVMTKGLKKDKHQTLFDANGTILAIHNMIQNHFPPSEFIPVFCHLFYALVVLHETPSRLKSVIKASLVEIVNDVKPGPACVLIERVLFHPDEICQNYTLTATDDGVSIEVVPDNKIARCSSNQTIVKSLLVSLLKECKNDMLTLELFFHFKDISVEAENDRIRDFSISLVEFILHSSMDSGENGLDLLGIVATNPPKSVELITRTLVNHRAMMERSDENKLDEIITESIDSCIKILEVLNVTLHGSFKLEIRRCMPVLEEILSLLDTKPSETATKVGASVKSLISQLRTNENRESGHDVKFEKELESILEELNHRIVPVRVHALVKLKQMVSANDAHVISRLTQIYTLVETSLADQEPYVFLASINLLSEIVLRRTEEFLPKLTALYSQQDLDLQHRINVGEVLVRLMKRCGKMTPFYAQQVMATMLKNCDDPEELVRMSSLTNIGQMCGSLGDSLGKYMVDIMALVERLVEHDTIQVKCAAMELLRSTLSGLDALHTESIQRDLKSVYNVIKRVRQRTLDEGLCLQANLCLDEMDRLARELLGGSSAAVEANSSERLVKNIRVLSLTKK